MAYLGRNFIVVWMPKERHYIGSSLNYFVILFFEKEQPSTHDFNVET
jgi:hypothetical protein